MGKKQQTNNWLTNPNRNFQLTRLMNRKVSINITNTNTYEKLTTDNGKRINSIPKMAINSQAKHKFKNK